MRGVQVHWFCWIARRRVCSFAGVHVCGFAGFSRSLQFFCSFAIVANLADVFANLVDLHTLQVCKFCMAWWVCRSVVSRRWRCGAFAATAGRCFPGDSSRVHDPTLTSCQEVFEVPRVASEHPYSTRPDLIREIVTRPVSSPGVVLLPTITVLWRSGKVVVAREAQIVCCFFHLVRICSDRREARGGVQRFCRRGRDCFRHSLAWYVVDWLGWA